MADTTHYSTYRGFGLGLAAALALVPSAFAQAPAPVQTGPQGPVCQRLETQLATFDRGSNDGGRADQIRRYEDAANRQQAELDRSIQQSRNMGCEQVGFFGFRFGNVPAQCGPLNNQIHQMRANLDRLMMDLQRMQGSGFDSERDGQRRAILSALYRNDCGPQYRNVAATPAAQPSRGIFDGLFGTPNPEYSDAPQSTGLRSICVRTCDGYYFPISYSTSQERLREDERTCQRMCPAAEVVLFSHRNQGEDVSQAVSTTGRLYNELPNAFRYRQEFNPSCSCKRPGESWAEAVKSSDDRSGAAYGDIVVTEERAKTLSQPRDARGRPVRPVAPAPATAGTPAAKQSDTAEKAASAEPPPPDGTKKTIRSVGPVFLPAQ